MSALATTHPTLLDVANRLDPQGNIDKIVEILNEQNEIINDAVFLEGNLPTGHRTTIRSGLPAPTWRKLYGGVQPTKSRAVQVTDNTGMLEAYAEVDKALADLNGNTASFRMSEDVAHIEGMNQEFASTLLYGNEGTEPEAFTGFAPRFNSLSAENGENIIDCTDLGASSSGGDNTSAWLVVWGPNTVHAIYPKGSKAGLSMTDKGLVTIENIDGSGGRMEAYRSHYRWDVGLTVRDWRYVARVVNIDVSNMATPAYAKLLLGKMIEAEEKIPSLSSGRPVWYMNRTLRTYLRQGIIEKVSNQLTFENFNGKLVTMFDGIPVRRVDQILKTETAVS
jgi:Major capsid protein GP7